MSFKSGNSSNHYSYVTTPQRGDDGVVYDSQSEARVAQFFSLLGIQYKPVYATFFDKDRQVQSFLDIKGNGATWSPDGYIAPQRAPGYVYHNQSQRVIFVEVKPMPYPDLNMMGRMRRCLEAQYGGYDLYMPTVRGFQVYMDDLTPSDANADFMRVGWDCGYESEVGTEVLLALLVDPGHSPRPVWGLVRADNRHLNIIDGRTYKNSVGALPIARKHLMKATDGCMWKPYKPVT